MTFHLNRKLALTSSALLCLLGAGVGAAAPPKSPKFEDYAALLQRSPFVIKKVATPDAAPVVNKTLSLRGVMQMNGVWRAYLVDRKEPTKTIVLNMGEQTGEGGLKLVEVKQDKKNYLNTQIIVSSGGQMITVAYNVAEIKSGIMARTAAQTQQQTKPVALPPGFQGRPRTNEQPGQNNQHNNRGGGRPRIRPTNGFR